MNLARLGFKTALHSPVGDDAAGRMIAAELTAGGVEFLSERDPKGTERHTNIMDKEGRRISIYCAYPSFEPAIDQDALEARFASFDIIVLNIINYCRRLIPAAREAMKAKAGADRGPGTGPEAWRPNRGGLWVDIHDWDGKNEYHRDFVEAASVIFMSSDGMADWRSFMKAQVAEGKELVVCTHGAKGASALWRDGSALDCPIVEGYGYRDSNGAGDAFFSGFMAAAARGLGKEACLRMASLAGALSVASESLAHPAMNWPYMLSEYERTWGEAAR